MVEEASTPGAPSPTGTAASAWPPTNAAVAYEPGLPSPAFVIARASFPAVATIIFLPVLLFGSYARLLRNGLPVSRMVNPGTIGLLALIVVALGARLGPRAGKPTVLAGADWVAGRGLLSGHWRKVALAQADRYSLRVIKTRSTTKTLLTITGPAGEKVSFSFAPSDPGLEELLTALRRAGAQEVDRSAVRSLSWQRTTLVTTAAIALFSLPVVYLEVGPLRLLPKPVAGLFTWSGCRAAFAAEGDHPTGGTQFLTNPLPAGGTDWSLMSERQLDAAAFAQQTENPSARLTHLRRDGLVVGFQSFIRSPDGAVLAVEQLRFSTQTGALAYERYVDRAVCEHEFGSHGPRATEVRLFRGNGTIVRWVAGNTLEQVVQTPSRPFPSRQQVDAVATALGG